MVCLKVERERERMNICVYVFQQAQQNSEQRTGLELGLTEQLGKRL